MTKEALADRIITYSDALAAFSLVNALAFVITLAEPDIRCSIANIAVGAIVGNVLIAVAITVALVALRRFERSLRPAGSQDARVERFWRVVQTVRITLVWGVVVFASFGLWAATLDPTCAVAGG